MDRFTEQRLRVNAESKDHATHDGETWTDEEMEWLRSWEGGEPYLIELAEMLGRTIEACRQRFNVYNRIGWVQTSVSVRVRVGHVRVSAQYRGWTEGDGDE